ncbi:MAG: TM2 domain-containing protein [Woeseiaceae bacterium]|nr:TM2 domain-containing protein [Woeseiaceae bacterium]
MFEGLNLRKEDVADREEAIRQRVGTLEPSLRKTYYKRVGKEIRDPDTYAVLNYFFLAGLHHMYLGKWLRGSVNLVVLIAGIVLMFQGYPGYWLVVFILLVELMALFRSEVIVNHHNNNVAERILTELL